MTVRLVALDIDGTLLDPGVPVSALPEDPMSRAVKQLLVRTQFGRRLIANGWPFTELDRVGGEGDVRVVAAGLASF